jgi:iron-sulfur cluster insertion protein
MTIIRCLSLVLCVSTAAIMLGCNDSPSSELPGSSPTAPAASKKPFAGSDESPTVTVTPIAAATISQLIADQKTKEKLYLRVRVVPGGCQGFMHKLDLDPDVSGQDHVCESSGVTIVIFKRQVEMLRGTQVDFGEEDGRRGFKIDNPNFKGEWTKKWLALLEREKDIK